jgi:cytidylate kinase
VILGRAAAVVLGKDRGFHVRLDGPPERRVAQGAVVEGISEEQARERLRAADKARTAYVRRLYRTDPADPALYHLVIDSTALPLEVVTELVLAAARAHAVMTEPVTARS